MAISTVLVLARGKDGFPYAIRRSEAVPIKLFDEGYRSNHVSALRLKFKSRQLN